MTPQITVNHHGSQDDLYDTEDDEDSGEDLLHHSSESHDFPYDDEDDDDESWDHLDDPDIHPEESASHSREHLPTARSRSRSRHPTHYPAARDPPRRKSPHIRPAVVEPPTGPPPRQRARGSRERRSRPRSVAELEQDDYPYGRGGQLPFHPAQGWGNINLYPSQAHTAISGYENSYGPGALIYPPRGGDPFSPYGAGANPFTQPPDDYYARRNHRNSMPPRPQDGALMPFNQGFAGFPPYGFPPYGFPYGYGPAPHQSPSPHHSKKTTPAPGEDKSATPAPAGTPPVDPQLKAIQDLLKSQEERAKKEADQREKEKADAKKAEEEKKRKDEEDKLEALQKLILKHNAEQLEREKKQEEKAKAEKAQKEAAEKAAAEAKKAADEKAKEVKAAAEEAKRKAEEEAKKKAEEEKAKWDKEMEEQKEKAKKLEEAKKKAEEEANKLKPPDDMKLPPIKFKDAVGRKFSFPWHLCKTWKGMEALIHQAFLHVDQIGQHVHEGHYDLVGPDGEIILPQVWDTMVKPDMAITMHMWPMPEPPPQGPLPIPVPMPAEPHHDKHRKDKKGKTKHGSKIPPPPQGPLPMPAPAPMGMPPPPPMPGPPPGMMGGMPPPPGPLPPPPGPGVMEGPVGGAPAAIIPPREKKKKKKEPAPGLLWFAGGQRQQSLKYGKEPESAREREGEQRQATAMKKTSSQKKVASRRASVLDAPSAPNGAPLTEQQPSAPNGKPASQEEGCVMM